MQYAEQDEQPVGQEVPEMAVAQVPQAGATKLAAATRSSIYEAIDTERSHQESNHNMDQSLGDYLLQIAKYTDRAKWAYTSCTARDVKSALASIRKIAAIAVAAMENHGVVNR